MRKIFCSHCGQKCEILKESFAWDCHTGKKLYRYRVLCKSKAEYYKFSIIRKMLYQIFYMNMFVGCNDYHIYNKNLL